MVEAAPNVRLLGEVTEDVGNGEMLLEAAELLRTPGSANELVALEDATGVVELEDGGKDDEAAAVVAEFDEDGGCVVLLVVLPDAAAVVDTAVATVIVSGVGQQPKEK